MRRITSIILVIAFFVVSVTGIQLTTAHGHGGEDRPLKKYQQLAASNNSAGVSFEKPLYPKEVHQWAGFLFIGAGLVHLGLNIRPMMTYFKRKDSIS